MRVHELCLRLLGCTFERFGIEHGLELCMHAGNDLGICGICCKIAALIRIVLHVEQLRSFMDIMYILILSVAKHEHCRIDVL